MGSAKPLKAWRPRSRYKKAARQAARALRDDNPIGLGQGLQARCQVGRFADRSAHRLGNRSDDVSRDYGPAGDADPHCERLTVRPQFRHGGDDRERRADRPLRVVLSCVWIAEIDQRPSPRYCAT